MYEGVKTQRRNEEAWVAMIDTSGENKGTESTHNSMSVEEIKQKQMNDEQIRPVMEAVAQNTELPDRDRDNPLWWERKKLHIDKHGVLRRVTAQGEQLVFPKSMRKLILEELHCNMGHLGQTE